MRQDEIEFGGRRWQQIRDSRRHTTALSAAANYGPGLRQLGWATPHLDHADVMVPTEQVAPALDAFESKIAHFLRHEAFATLGRVRVSLDEVAKWGDAWALDRPTKAEARVMKDLLLGPSAPQARRVASELMLSAVNHLGNRDPDGVRAAMCGAPSDFHAPAHLVGTRDAWRRLQVRQLFRLGLEALFHWTLQQLGSAPRSIDSLVTGFLHHLMPRAPLPSAQAWLASLSTTTAAPTDLMRDIEDALYQEDHDALAAAIVTAIAFCLDENSKDPPRRERRERLPISRAREEADARGNASVPELMRHVLESWVIAQHSFWAVGRGLADARAGGRILLRLKLVLDESGWALTPGASLGGIL